MIDYIPSSAWLLEKKDDPVLVLFPDTSDLRVNVDPICFKKFTDWNEYSRYCQIMYDMGRTRTYNTECWEIVNNKVAGEYIANG